MLNAKERDDIWERVYLIDARADEIRAESNDLQDQLTKAYLAGDGFKSYEISIRLRYLAQEAKILAQEAHNIKSELGID